MTFLLSKDMGETSLTPFEGFRLARRLILVGKISPKQVESLVFVRPENGAFQIHAL